jgi:hypothetical protein
MYAIYNRIKYICGLDRSAEMQNTISMSAGGTVAEHSVFNLREYMLRHTPMDVLLN